MPLNTKVIAPGRRSIAARAGRAGLWIAVGSTLAAAPRSVLAAVPALDHIVVIVMENHSYNQVRVLPYTASLMTAHSYSSASFGVTHPSQPNYLALWAGSTLGVTSNTCPAPGSPFTAENLGHACEVAGVSWKSYNENLPAPGSAVCTVGTLYTRKHNPWTNFSNLTHANERPFTDLAADIAANQLPRLAFVVPNNCNNTHDCALAVGDAWLQNNVPGLINAAGPRGLVVVTWDEDDNISGNRILTVFAGPQVRSGFVSTQTMNHYTLLRTLCDGLGIPPFANAVSQQSVSDIWADTVSVQPVRWGAVKRLYR